MSEVSFLKLNSSVEGPHDKTIIIAPGDPGGGDFYGPAISYMGRDPNLDIVVMSTKIIEERFTSRLLLDLEPLSGLVVDELDPCLIASGVEVDDHLQVELREKFRGVPTAIADDTYGSVGYHLERGFRPGHIFTFNQVAKDSLVGAYASRVRHLEQIIEITGHPALDETLNEEIFEKRREIMRAQLGLHDKDNLVACFATINAAELVQQFAQEIAKSSMENLRVVFNKHPRDPIDISEYWKIFEDAGVSFGRTDNMEYPELIAAADAVAILPQSTVASHAVHHVPTIHVQRSQIAPILSQATVAYGASPLVVPSDFLATLEKLWDSTNPQRDIMRENARRLYPMDQNSAARVAASIGRIAQYSIAGKAA
jgi:hypothetical protein